MNPVVSKASEINAIADISRASSVPDTMTQLKADYQSCLWMEAGERRRSGDIAFPVTRVT